MALCQTIVRDMKMTKIIFDQWPKLHLGLDALSNHKILRGVYWYMYQKQVIASFSDHSYGSIDPFQFFLLYPLS